MYCLFEYLHDHRIHHFQMRLVHFQVYMLVDFVDKLVNYNRQYVMMYTNDEDDYLDKDFQMNRYQIHLKTKI
jgi:hypothetical protein